MARNHFFFPCEARLRRQADFSACYQSGTRFYSRHFILFVLSRKESDQNARLGMAISRKVGNAVVRNRIKRVLREFFRFHSAMLLSFLDIVVVAKRLAEPWRPDLATITGELYPLIAKINREIPRNVRGIVA